MSKVIDENNKKNKELEMYVYNDNDFLSPYTNKTEGIINSEVAEFLQNSANSIPLKSSITINIHSDCITKKRTNLISVCNT